MQECLCFERQMQMLIHRIYCLFIVYKSKIYVLIFIGSFKIRGVINQLLTLPDGSETQQYIAMSAGNYGKAFVYIANKMGLNGTIIMPDTAPLNRAELIEVKLLHFERGITPKTVP